MSTDYSSSEGAKLISDLSKTMKKFMRKTFDEVGLTMPQTAVMHILMKCGKMKISELSEKVKLSNSTVSGIVDRLEKQELVVRIRNYEDRRIVYVEPTKKYEEIHKAVHEKVSKGFEDMLSSATDEEKEKIVSGLTTLKKVLNEKMN